MADEKAPERSPEPSDVTVRSVTISVLPAVKRPPPQERLAGVGVPRRASTLLAAAAALVALGAIVATGFQRSPTARPVRANRIGAQELRRPSRAAALEYPYPLRCASMAISAIDPVYVAEVERANGCRGYSRYVRASLHRVSGGWRLVLDEGQLFRSNIGGAYRVSLGCLSLAVAFHDPTFVGPDRATCIRGRPVWLP
jgi:hypothetical protein